MQNLIGNFASQKARKMSFKLHTRTHTHTHTYIYGYFFRGWGEGRGGEGGPTLKLSFRPQAISNQTCT